MIIVYRDREYKMETHINNLVNEKLKSIRERKNVFKTGVVTKVKDYIIEVEGLEGVKFFEKVTIWEKGFGYVNSVNENFVTIAVIKQKEQVEIGDIVNASGELFKTIYSPDALGRVTDMFGIDKLVGK
jgi:F-type H+-transporting ATPase subunit alpha